MPAGKDWGEEVLGLEGTSVASPGEQLLGVNSGVLIECESGC